MITEISALIGTIASLLFIIYAILRLIKKCKNCREFEMRDNVDVSDEIVQNISLFQKMKYKLTPRMFKTPRKQENQQNVESQKEESTINT